MNPVIQKFAKPYTYREFGPGKYVGVDWQDGAEVPGSPKTALMSIQPMTARERLLLPEGQREKDAVNVYTEALMQTTQQLPGGGQSGPVKGALIQYEGRDWEVKNRQDWTKTRYPFYKYQAFLVEVDI